MEAATFGILNDLKESHISLGNELTIMCSCRAAKSGNIDRLKYLHDSGCEWGVKTCMYAAFYGQVECLKYLYENGCPWDKATLYCCVHKGHLECVKFFLENEEEGYGKDINWGWGTNLCYYAAYYGHLKVLKYLRVKGYTWDEKALISCSRYGHIDILKYANDNGFNIPMEQCLLVSKIRKKNIDCVKYIESLIHRNKAAIKIQSAARGIMTRKRTGFHNPHTEIGRRFIFAMFHNI
jgi:hypothetical protein